MSVPLGRFTDLLRRTSSFAVAFALSLLGPAVSAAVLPAGTALSIRLTSPVSSRSARPGDPVAAVLIAPVPLGDSGELPAGATVLGRVREARGRHGRAGLLLRFDRIVSDADSGVPIQARVAEVDNAREKVSPDGRIVGVPGLMALPSRWHALLMLAACVDPVPLAGVEGALLFAHAAGRAAIRYGPGVEMTLVTETAAVVPAAAPERRRSLPEAQALAALAARAPLFAGRGRVQRSADLTNVLVIGSEAEVQRSFESAGWVRAEGRNGHALTRSLWALAERRAYRSAPVSQLELDGRPPDLVFEKQNDTLAKRHHLRLWRLAEGFEGRPAWLGAATHDVGIGFDRSQRWFTHRVAPEVDRERDKVVDDLEFAGAVEASRTVARPDVPRRFANGRVEMVTDGGLAVVSLEAARPLRASSLVPPIEP